MIHWLVLPGVPLVIAAVVLGWRLRRNGGSETGADGMIARTRHPR